MGRFVFILFSSIICSPSFAITGTVTPTVNSHFTPSSSPQNPNIYQVNRKINFLYKEINHGVKSGKISKEQGDSFMSNLKNVHNQKKEYLILNKKSNLTDEQTGYLLNALDEISKSLNAVGLP